MRKIKFTVLGSILSGISYMLLSEILNTIKTYPSLVTVVTISAVISFNTAIILDYLEENAK